MPNLSYTVRGIRCSLKAILPFNLIRELGNVKVCWDVNKNWMDLNEFPGAVQIS